MSYGAPAGTTEVMAWERVRRIVVSKILNHSIELVNLIIRLS